MAHDESHVRRPADGVQPTEGSPLTPPSSRTRSLVRLIASILLAQALFWGLFYMPWGPKPSFDKIDRIPFANAQLAELTRPTPSAADAATHRKVNLPYVDCCDPSYLSLKMTFEVPEPPVEGLGLVAFQQVDNFIYRINGSIIHQRGRMDMGRQTFHGQRPYVLHVPQGLLKAGENELSIITVREGHPYTDLIEPLMGPHRQVQELTALRLWQTVDYRMLGGMLTLTLGLFGLIMIFRSQEKRFAFWLTVLCWAWTAYAAYGLYLSLPLSGVGRLIFFFAVTALVNSSLVCFIDAWTRRPLPWVQPVMMAVWAAFTAVAVYAMYVMPQPSGHDLMTALWGWFGFAAGVAVVVRLLWHFAVAEEVRVLEASILSVCAVCLALDGIGGKFGLLSGAYLIESAPLLLLAMLIAFIQRNFHLFQSALSLNSLLESNLKKREAELEEAHQRERQLTELQARNEERRRLMQDMHDGVGGQLVGLLLEVRRGAADNERMAEGLQAAMDEIRLMIDSVDAPGTSLETMLCVFENRVRPRVEGAGFGFDWDVHMNTPADLSPNEVLQIFRVMQEAVTNAMKHSGGDRISVTVKDLDGTLDLSIRDNGHGLTENDAPRQVGQGGHGLGNMSMRAQSIGGELAWEDARPGTCVRLRVPLRSGLPQAA
ncbi:MULTISPECIES: sensor histidine kinase [unclassified Brevundimonas]|uniref:sensor histidine kinase n=1 Tax=unclassified Brevundimonas TaxID=2622653 RepID=UPI0025C1A564|nr:MULTISPECIES: ATP-binding protein [unclassified Brevundimonas]